jgi:hypothetical protein
MDGRLARRRFAALLFSVILVGAVGAAPALAASPNRLEADLDGASVSGGGDPDGSGSITVWIDPSLTCSFIRTDGIDEITAIEVRAGVAGEDLGLVADITPEPFLVPGPCAGTDGIDFTAVIADPTGHHILVRTDEYPDGALRGQLRAATTNNLRVIFGACPSTVRGLADVPPYTDFEDPGPCRPVIRSGNDIPDGYRWVPEAITFDWTARLTTASGAVLTETDFDDGAFDTDEDCDAATKTCNWPPNSGTFLDPSLTTAEVVSGLTTLRLLSAPPGHKLGFADVWADTTNFSDEPIDTIRRVESTTTADPATISFDSTGFDVAVVRVYFSPLDLPETSTVGEPQRPGPDWVLVLLASLIGLVVVGRGWRSRASRIAG